MITKHESKAAAPTADAAPARSDTDLIAAARNSTSLRKAGIFFRLLGPGWLQSALKLGGGTMTGSLYLGVLSGFSMLWLQPLAMFLGIIMLWALAYVVMCTGRRPFRAITEHVNPVLGWGWVTAALFSSMIWDLPQYAMSYGVISQNLLPNLFSGDGAFAGMTGRVAVSGSILLLCTAVTWSFTSKGSAGRVFDWILQAMVWMIVACFIGVVVRLTWSQSVDWQAAMAGFVPDFSLLSTPAKTYAPLLADLAPAAREFWEGIVVKNQRDVMIASVAAAAGVNGTFLLGYSVLRRKWGADFRIFSRVDLMIGMFLPFSIASSCVVVAGAHQFHTVPVENLVAEGAGGQKPTPRQADQFRELMRNRVLHEFGRTGEPPAAEIESRVAALSTAERKVAATLVTRDGLELALSIEPLTGRFVAHGIFGLGVLGMCISSIVLHMAVCGMVVCEMLDRPHTGWTFRWGSMAAAVGALGPFVWSKAAFWLAIPVAVFSYTLIPLTYVTFFLMMNSRSLLGEHLPRGGRRWSWNIAMGVAVTAFCASSVWMLWVNAGYKALGACGLFLLAAAIAHFVRPRARLRPVPPSA